MINRRSNRKDITTATINRRIIDRYYLEEAVKRIMESFRNDKTWQALVVMATGTGKTRLSIATVDILAKHIWVRRVLFLADTTALLIQAKKKFNKLLPHATLVNLVEKKEDENSRIVFPTYPTIMNLIDDTKQEGERKYGVGHFDLIIIDEAHRSVYQKYGAIFDYFDSLLLGLTATPRDEVDRDTYGLFGLESGNPTYSYELDQAISDEYLVGFKTMSVPLKFQRDGVKYADLPEEEREEYEDSSELEAKGIAELRGDLLNQMHEVVSRLDTDNFIVRPKRKCVEESSKRERWNELTTGDVADISQNLASLPYTDDDEELARRFDLLMLNLHLAILETSPQQDRYQRQVMTLLGNLEEKQAIPSVAKQLDLILELQRDEYWQNITLPMIESVRQKLRELIKFIDQQGGQEIVYTTSMDDMGEATEVEGFAQADPMQKDYRLRVERFIRDHEHHITI